MEKRIRQQKCLNFLLIFFLLETVGVLHLKNFASAFHCPGIGHTSQKIKWVILLPDKLSGSLGSVPKGPIPLLAPLTSTLVSRSDPEFNSSGLPLFGCRPHQSEEQKTLAALKTKATTRRPSPNLDGHSLLYKGSCQSPETQKN